MIRKFWCALWGHEDNQTVTIGESCTLRVCSRCRRESWSGSGDDETLARARRLLADGKLPVARMVLR